MKIAEKINQKNLTRNLVSDIVLAGVREISPETLVF